MFKLLSGILSKKGDRKDRSLACSHHLTSEYFIKTEARGRNVDEWKQRPEQPDNHWFDCLVGSAVAASMQGCVLSGTDTIPKKSSRISFREMQGKKR